MLGVSGDVLARTEERPVYLRRLAGTTPLGTLIRLFLLDEPVPCHEAERTLAPHGVDDAIALGLFVQTGDDLRGTVRIVPHGDLVLASDLPDREDDHGDHVAGLHRPSITLADLTIREPARRGLDMGTGFGVQALLMARHTQHVVATDINGRALAFARLNAAMNGVTNIEFREGSFFEPVAGERFDLVACNPPYVISPETAFLFRDSGLGRDRVSAQLVDQLPGMLAEGGFGTIMVSWIQAGDDPISTPRLWLAGGGCDAWVLYTPLEDPLTAAAGWNRDDVADATRYGEAMDRWLAYFRAEGIEALAYGAILVRRRTPTADSPNWIRSRVLPGGSRATPADHVSRMFSGPDRSAALSDAAIADQALQLAVGATITTRLRRIPDGWAEAADLSIDPGIPFSFDLDGFTAGFVVRLDGTRSLGDVLDGFAAEHDAPPERVRASGVRIARELLELGLAVIPETDNLRAGD